MRVRTGSYAAVVAGSGTKMICHGTTGSATSWPLAVTCAASSSGMMLADSGLHSKPGH